MPETAPRTLDQALTEMDRAWTAWLTAIDAVPPGGREERIGSGEWSPRLIAGHVAFWDGFEADRIRRRGEIDEVDWQALNDRSAQEMANRSYDDLRAGLDANHARLLAAVAETPDLDPDWLVGLTVEHYDEHAAEIQNWLANGQDIYGPAEPVASLLPRLDEAWADWLATIEIVPENAREVGGVTGAWSACDLLGHVAFWDTQVIDDIDGYVAGRPPIRGDWETWNRQDAERKRERPWDELFTEMTAAHDRMRARLSEVTEIDPEMVGVDTWLHYADHAAEIRRWLDQTAGG